MKTISPDEEAEKEIWLPLWHCFCCQDTGKIQSHLVRRVIPGYNYERDRLPICQNCNKGHDWFHLDDLGVIDTRLGPQICRKLDAVAREDWRLTAQAWFEMVKQRLEDATREITSEHNLTSFRVDHQKLPRTNVDVAGSRTVKRLRLVIQVGLFSLSAISTRCFIFDNHSS